MKLAVIPARGGSKRIPRKNVRLFAGQPMIAYAVQAAQRAEVFDRILVSTDDAEIAEVALRCGASVPFLRPAALADDHTPTVPVVQHAMDEARALGWPPTLVCCIYPGVPLLSADDLRRALALLQDRGADFVFPVLAFGTPVQRALRRLDDGRTEPLFPDHVSTRSQDLEPAFHDAGQFYWGREAAWRSGRSPHQGGLAMVVPAWRAVDIDTPDDWRRAEALFAAQRGGLA